MDESRIKRRIIPATHLKSCRCCIGMWYPDFKRVGMKVKAFLTAWLMLAASSALAAARADIVVEGVQAPAWVERASGARGPLALGMGLGHKDRNYTRPPPPAARGRCAA